MNEQTANIEDRPGCFTVYAFFTWFYALLVTCGGLATGLALFSGLEPDGFTVGVTAGTFLGGLAIGLLLIILGIGVWKMKKWSNSLGIGVHSFFAIGGIFAFIGIGLTGNTITLSDIGYGLVIQMVVNAGLAYWFFVNRTRFNA